ncbi:4-(cytidine 5'-diphospho)-2-C-methyl-D-erythritol kinase [bacterium]|nr:4-(cytidine 5'-diphospho)-2-C-methyl-D-erythritol kinase [bacterium]PIV81383.1 MAG: 4-(cytidine 5'-diphospho)-2-C-methyl-D-erythritol kinase [bacterium CG17_big_fil_post_rev_8_21_14_2_50_64_8]PJA73468.1 MAG: 4-(cytidine 5'-diphospho)-2-C-methyl-D-erythritol kinase [bacterium CG_4_9_14_3_um_filter_65_15]
MGHETYTKGRLPVGRTVSAEAPAKVNLHLEVLKARHDGYHEIETVLQTVDLCDRLEVTLKDRYPGGSPDITLQVSAGDWDVPADSTNLCWRAARLFCRSTGVSGALRMELVKAIPPAAGLGGGSSDAAAVLVACNHLFATGLEEADLEALGAELGADVPFFVRGGTALGRGTGTRLTPLPLIRSGQFLIVRPDMELKTSEVYANLKMGLTVNSAKANIHVIRPQLARFPRKTWPGFNRLEEVVLPWAPSLQRLVFRLREIAPIAMMSGSGSAVYGVFPDGQDTDEWIKEFEEAGYFVRNVRPRAFGVRVREGKASG